MFAPECLQCLDISAVADIESGGGLGGLEFRAHVAAEVTVCSLPFALGVAVDETVQLSLQMSGAVPGELLHKRPVNSPGLVERDRNRLGGCLDMLSMLV